MRIYSAFLGVIVLSFCSLAQVTHNPGAMKDYQKRTERHELRNIQNEKGEATLAEVGLHHRRLQLINPKNTSESETNSAWLIQPGLNYLDQSGNLVESVPLFKRTAGAYTADQLQFKVSIGVNLAQPRHVQVTLPHGEKVTSQILALQYFDRSASNGVTIAVFKPSTANQSATNAILFADAFDGVDADIVYSVAHDRFEQDVVLRSQPPLPSEFGLNPETTTLEVVTEFVDTPTTFSKLPGSVEPVDQVTAGRAKPTQDGDSDTTIDFGTMRIGRGYSFDSNVRTNSSYQTNKRWATASGRNFLIESLNYTNVLAGVQSLPKNSKKLRVSIDPQHRIGDTVRLLAEAPQRNQVDNHFNQQASSGNFIAADHLRTKSGYTIDYVQIINSAGFVGMVYQDSTQPANLTFKSGQTYVINGYVFLYGTTTIEGGAVIKYPRFQWGPNVTQYRMWTYGPINCRTSSHNPAIVTATDDDRFGTKLRNTGVPSIESDGLPIGRTYGTSSIGNVALWSPRLDLHDINFHYQGSPIVIRTSSSQSGLEPDTVYNCQFNSPITWDFTIIVASDAGAYIGNCLFKNSWCPVYLDWEQFNSNYNNTAKVTFQNCTLCNPFWYMERYSGCTIQPVFENCILGQQRDYWHPFPGIYTSSKRMDAGNSLATAPWPCVSSGGGDCYLGDYTENLVGTAPRSGGLLNPLIAATLSERSTQAPQIISGSLNGLRRLDPLVRRGNPFKPDYGYHYPAIDYLLTSSLQIGYGANVLLTNNSTSGIVIATAGGASIDIGDGSRVCIEGLATSRSKVVSQRAVQEEALNANSGDVDVFTYQSPNNLPPIIEFRFAEITSIPGRTQALLGIGDKRLARLEMRNSEFNSIGITYRPQSSPYGLEIAYATIVNNVFVRGLFSIGTSDGGDHNLQLDLRNNTFYQQLTQNTGASQISFMYGGGQLPWMITENIFDGAIPQISGTISTAWDYNWFTAGSVVGGDTHGVVDQIAYTNGPLGNWYLYSTSTYPVGGWSAQSAGLYHWTVNPTNGSKDGSNLVAIGYHYVGLDQFGRPYDSDGDKLPDYLEDRSGDNMYSDVYSFYMGDVINLSAMVNRMNAPVRQVDIWLKSKLSSQTVTALPSANVRALQHLIVTDLNQLISGVSVNSTGAFGAITLRSVTSALLAQNPQGENLRRLNRLLLEDAFSTELSRSQHGLAFGFETSLTGMTDADGLTDYYELAVSLNPASYDSDGDGVNDADEIRLGTNPMSQQSTAQKRLAYWKFDDVQMKTEDGCLPSVNSADWVDSFSGKGAGFTTTGKLLNYPVSWTIAGETRANIDFWNGSIRFTYVPNWGEGRSVVSPGSWCRLLECGTWSLSVSPDGRVLSFQTPDLNGLVKTNLLINLPVVAVPPGERKGYEIELNYTPGRAWIAVNGKLFEGELGNQKSGIETDLPTTSKARGLWIGSGANGSYPCQGLIDEIETFNIPCTQTKYPDSPYSNPFQKIWDLEIARSRGLITKETPQGILLQWKRGWEGDWAINPSSYSISRRKADTKNWTTITTAVRGSTYLDVAANLTPGVIYEYRVNRLNNRGIKESPTAFGLFQDRVKEKRGNAIIVVDKTLADDQRIQDLIADFKSDLISDGWQLPSVDIAGERHIDIQHPYNGTNDPAYRQIYCRQNSVNAIAIRDAIRTRVVPGMLNIAFLIGHVAIPISGHGADEDGHNYDYFGDNGDHRGPYPADSFYGDLDGVWTDSAYYEGANFLQGPLKNDLYRNEIGDGIWDQNFLPPDISPESAGVGSGTLEAGVARIDFHYLPTASLEGEGVGASTDATERRLLKEYLEKVRDWRYGGSPMVLSSDFKDTAALFAKLKTPATAVSIYLRNRLGIPAKTLLDSWPAGTRPSTSLVAEITKEINGILKGVSIWDEQRFQGVSLRPETQALIAQNPTGSALVRLNRLLFEDSYSIEVTRRRFGNGTVAATPFLEYMQDGGFVGLLPTGERIQALLNPDRQPSLLGYQFGADGPDIFQNCPRVEMAVYGGYGSFGRINTILDKTVFSTILPRRTTTTGFPNAYFGVFQGSYFEEWNHYEDDLMKMLLIGDETMLAVSWLASLQAESNNSAFWKSDRFLVGEPYGTSLIDTFSAVEEMSVRSSFILGDPFLRRSVPRPVDRVFVVPKPEGGTSVSWDPDPSPVPGATYAIFAANSANPTSWTFIEETVALTKDYASGIGTTFLIKVVHPTTVGGLTFKNCSIGRRGQ